jgi:hypothetical protein
VFVFLLATIAAVCATGWIAIQMALAGVSKGPSPAVLAQASQGGAAFFSYQFYVVIAGICFFALAVPTLTWLLIINFEKTQAPEYVFFVFFLVACLFELVRLLIPVLNLWDSMSAMVRVSARILLFGRLLGPASFLFPAVYAVNRKDSDIGRNILILVAVCGIFALLTPVNMGHILPVCAVETGYQGFLRLFVLMVSLLSVVSFIIAARPGGREQRLLAAGYVLLFAGYLILLSVQSFFALFTGILLFTAGVYIYLTNLHNIYMWN